ncbi:translation initiation factor IF-2-like [Aquila chrysaetos chrysaetos]|uniref:translation initiation factor IF-2-like n=1 Tax=Aquila chrysaetos chrysaetos TaxID=223781 RepID=UPI0011767037|nr:translation initiation factor IF-2-like [Aquila chrysaetos chrysaetos]
MQGPAAARPGQRPRGRPPSQSCRWGKRLARGPGPGEGQRQERELPTRQRSRLRSPDPCVTMWGGLPAPQSKQAGELPPMTNSFSATAGAAVPRFPDDDPIPPPLRRGRGGFTAPLPGPTAPRGDPHPLPPAPQGPLLSLPSPAEEAVFGPGREESGEPPCPIQFRPGAGGGGGGLTSRPAGPGGGGGAAATAPCASQV